MLGRLGVCAAYSEQNFNLGSYCGITLNRCYRQLIFNQMFKRKTVFITIEFADVPGLFDYPKHLPLPRIGERVIFNGKFGRVSEVSHVTEDTVVEIKITCSCL